MGLASVSAWAMEASELEPTGPQPWVLDDKGVRQPLYKASHALLVSVSNYKSWAKLPTTRGELDQVGLVLQRHGFRVRRLHDPTGDELKREIEKFFGTYGQGSANRDHRLLFYFSGHGHTDAEPDRKQDDKEDVAYDTAYLVPQDAADPRQDATGFYSRALQIDMLQTWARSIRARHALFLFDSCFSGSIFTSRSQDGNTTLPVSSGTARQAYLEKQRTAPVRQFIAAGNAKEVVPARSQFTPGFLKALEGRAAGYPDGYVTGNEIGRWLEQTVPGFYQGREKRTHPHSGVIRDMKLAWGDMVFQIPGKLVEPDKGSSKPDGSGTRSTSGSAPPPPPPEPPAPGKRFRDCADDTCPWLVVIPEGKFQMGSPTNEEGRDSDEGPQHEVTIAKPLAVMEAEVTRGQFAAFVKATSYKQESGGCDWNSPGFEQTTEHPAVCISWNDAQAYAKWLAGKTGQSYRLLSEAEWEYATRAKTQTRYSFGDKAEDLCVYANVADRTAKAKFSGWTIAECTDGFVNTSPVKTYKPNAFGLFDLHGNAWEWVQDCWHGNYNGAPVTGVSWETNCKEERRVLRGGGWFYFPSIARSADRSRYTPGGRGNFTGFRLARTLTP